MALQRELASEVSHRNEVTQELHLVAGVDISGQNREGTVTGAVVLLRWPEMQVVEGVPKLPYIPGLLAFREAPILLGALARLTSIPDLILVDGHGFAHPRRFGIACHIGLLTQVPTVGCAKSILKGRYGFLGTERGSWSELVDGEEVGGRGPANQGHHLTGLRLRRAQSRSPGGSRVGPSLLHGFAAAGADPPGPQSGGRPTPGFPLNLTRVDGEFSYR